MPCYKAADKELAGAGLSSPVPKGEGPGAPSLRVETVTRTEATRLARLTLGESIPIREMIFGTSKHAVCPLVLWVLPRVCQE